MTTEFFIFGLARLTRICNPSTDSATALIVMRYWTFSQKTKLKQKIFTNSEKEVRNFFQDWDHSVHVNFIMKSQSFYLSLYFWSVGDAIFPLGRRKLCWVKFENALGNGFEKHSVKRPNFSIGEGIVGCVT